MPGTMMPMTPDTRRAELGAAHCWFDVDRVPGDPETTTWRRNARWAQSQWRVRNGWPIGSAPYAGNPYAVPVGSRLALDFARDTGANFLTARIRAAAEHRVKNPEPHQLLDSERLYADLLSSMPLCFNLFGECWRNPEVAFEAVRTWWPHLARREIDLRFEHSPGRRDPAYLGNRSAFDACFLLGPANAPRAAVGIETKYHEHAKVERAPSPAAMQRYVAVTERSEAFRPDWQRHVVGTDLQQIWLDHLLLLSMLQQPSRAWSQGLFVLAYPLSNTSQAGAARRYRAILRDDSTFEARTLEELVDGLPETLRGEFSARYLQLP